MAPDEQKCVKMAPDGLQMGSRWLQMGSRLLSRKSSRDTHYTGINKLLINRKAAGILYIYIYIYIYIYVDTCLYIKIFLHTPFF